jgi:hypothetical protein
MKYLLSAALAALIAAAPTLPVMAQSSRSAPENPATHHHGLPGNNPGFGGNSANPQGKGKNGGGGIHGIANVPGHNPDNHPSLGAPGFADQLGTVHGGLGGGHQGGRGGNHR